MNSCYYSFYLQDFVIVNIIFCFSHKNFPELFNKMKPRKPFFIFKYRIKALKMLKNLGENTQMQTRDGVCILKCDIYIYICLYYEIGKYVYTR